MAFSSEQILFPQNFSEFEPGLKQLRFGGPRLAVKEPGDFFMG